MPQTVAEFLHLEGSLKNVDNDCTVINLRFCKDLTTKNSPVSAGNGIKPIPWRMPAAIIMSPGIPVHKSFNFLHRICTLILNITFSKHD